MARALRVISVERGFDPRELHAGRLRRRGRDARLHARGGARDRDGARAACGRRPERARPGDLRPPPRLRAPLLRRPRRSTAPSSRRLSRTRAASASAISTTRACAASPTSATAGQSFELTVAGRRPRRARRPLRTPRTSGATDIAMPGETVQLVSLRLAAADAGAQAASSVEPDASETERLTGRAPAYFDGAWAEVPVRARDALGAARRSTVLRSSSSPRRRASCGPAGAASLDAAGALVLERS